MKKLFIVLALLLCFNSLVYAGVETVKDDNDGNKGYILINTGTKNGNSDVGHWTDISTIPELKGDKGDKGDTGANGNDGLNGTNGSNGIDGINGINGLDGQNGVNGINGIDGVKGDKGNIGETGQQGIKGDTGEQGNMGNKGDIGLTGEKGKDVDPTTVNQLKDTDTSLDNKIDLSNISINNNSKAIKDQNNRINDVDNRVNNLEITQRVIVGEIRVKDTKKWQVNTFVRYNETRNMIDTVGLRIQYKLGQSYEETLIEKQNELLKNLTENLYMTQTTYDEKGNLKSIKITEIK